MSKTCITELTDMIVIPGKYTTAHVMIDNVEPECIAQITEFVNHPAFTNPVAIMPDTHLGKGSVIGFTMMLGMKVIPNTIGVDVGCGVMATNIGNVDIDYAALDVGIRAKIPLGFDINSRPVVNFEREFDWVKANDIARQFRIRFEHQYGVAIHPVVYTYEWFKDLCRTVGAKVSAVEASVGTLGGGNHFIEVDVDSRGDKWVVIHTGSRNFGLKIADWYQKKAYDAINASRVSFTERVDEIRDRYASEPNKIPGAIADLRESMGLNVSKDLTYLEGEDAYDYYHAMIFAQQYATFNRKTIMNRILSLLPNRTVGQVIESVHNFIDFHDMVIRKGAVRSYSGESLIIPFNMRDGSIIGVGKSNPSWLCSAPHGAGRIMSRSVAKRQLRLDEYREQMQGIYSTSVSIDTIDEAPGAYKDANVIVDAITPSVEVVDWIKPVYNLKASEQPKKR